MTVGGFQAGETPRSPIKGARTPFVRWITFQQVGEAAEGFRANPLASRRCGASTVGARGFASQSLSTDRVDHRHDRCVVQNVRVLGGLGRAYGTLEPCFALQVLARIASSCDTRSRSRRDLMAATGRAASTLGWSRKAWDLRPCTRTQMRKVAWSREYSALVGDSSVRATLAPRIPSHAAIRTALTCIVRGPRGLTCRFVRSLDSQEHRDVARGNPRVVVASKHPITNTVA